MGAFSNTLNLSSGMSVAVSDPDAAVESTRAQSRATFPLPTMTTSEMERSGVNAFGTPLYHPTNSDPDITFCNSLPGISSFRVL